MLVARVGFIFMRVGWLDAMNLVMRPVCFRVLRGHNFRGLFTSDSDPKRALAIGCSRSVKC